jgi:protein SCO1/2
MPNNFLRNSLMILTGLFLAGMISCSEPQKQDQASGPLPILGVKDVQENAQSGGVDTLYHTIPDFRFVDQDSNIVTQETFADQIYVADFFFTTCPTICPVMKRQMHRLYEKLEGTDDVRLLSHTIDPEHDTVAVLKAYADRLGGIDAARWHLVTGDRDSIYEQARYYFENASADPTAPGGFIHSGYFYLIDKQRRVRGLYLGTDPEQVDRLMVDIKALRNEG